jgi:hypothetical protein
MDGGINVQKMSETRPFPAESAALPRTAAMVGASAEGQGRDGCLRLSPGSYRHHPSMLSGWIGNS